MSRNGRTDYSKLANRCPKCSHRREMHGKAGCEVEMGLPEDPKITEKCLCRRTF